MLSTGRDREAFFRPSKIKDMASQNCHLESHLGTLFCFFMTNKYFYSQHCHWCGSTHKQGEIVSTIPRTANSNHNFQLNGETFDEKDILAMEAFAMFCGIGIHNTKTYESTCKLMAKQRVALDCLSYHATATDNDTTWLARESIPQAKEFNLYRFLSILTSFRC